MIEEYENWEDSIRRTFIELANYMNKNSDPLESIIDFAWSAGADLFFVQNAKDELKKLKAQYIKDSLENPVAWARINDRGDLFDLRTQNNPYIDQNTVVPLYRKNHEQ
jgi:hypothetical protein